MKSIKSNSLEETKNIAIAIGKKLKKGDILAYKGGMGAGKTTFTHGLLEGIGSVDSVSSPTFSIVNSYQGDGFMIHHFDMYRILNDDDLYSIGFYDYQDGENILIIEWSENIEGELDDNVIVIDIEKPSENQRIFNVKGVDIDENFSY